MDGPPVTMCLIIVVEFIFIYLVYVFLSFESRLMWIYY